MGRNPRLRDRNKNMTSLSAERLAELDEAVRHMLRTGERSGFEIIGAGELACVVSVDGFACKRLPPMQDFGRLEAYGALLHDYIQALTRLDIPVIDSAWHTVTGANDHVGYILQPRVEAKSLLPAVMSGQSESDALEMLSVILDHVDNCVEAGVGIDPQISNWALMNGRPTLLDVTTPMLRDEQGKDLLDTEVFVVMLPILIRGFVRRFMISDILNKNFEKHGILLDLIGNIENYDLGHLTEPFLPAVNARLPEPLTLAEIQSYRREERWTWWAIRKALRIEQFWQRRIRNQATLHLLPSEFVRAGREQT
jgi:hypothetical protein